MKLLVRPLLIFVLSFLHSIYPMSINAQQPGSESIQQLLEKIKKSDQKIENIAKTVNECSQIKCVVATLGYTRAGKSTLLNWLAKKKQKAETIHGRQVVSNAEPSVPGMEVEHRATSVTKEPCHYYDSESKVLYMDCPGIGDTIPIDEIRNTYSIKKIFTTFKDIKVLLVVSADTMRADDKTVFAATIESLAKFFGSDIESVSNALCLVISKSDPDEKESYKAEIKHFLETARERQEEVIEKEKVATFTTNLLDRPMVLVRAANIKLDAKSFIPEPENSMVRSNLMKALDSCRVTSGLIPKPTVSDKAQNLAHVLSNALHEETNLLIEVDLVKLIILCIKNEMSTKNSASAVRSSLGELNQKLVLLLSSETYEGFTNELCNVLQKCSYNSDKKHPIVINIGLIIFLQSVNSRISLNLPNLKSPLIELQKTVELLSKDPVAVVAHGVLVMKGVFFDLKDIQRLFDTGQDIKKIHAYATNVVFCDSDLTCPGVSLVLIAPLWKISRGLTISLKGTSGENGADSHGSGADGSSGYHGQHGGHFYGKSTKELGNFNLLKVDTSGGNGGNGSHGQEGAVGTAGKDGSLEDSISKTEQENRTRFSIPLKTLKENGNNLDLYDRYNDEKTLIISLNNDELKNLYEYLPSNVRDDDSIGISGTPFEYLYRGSAGGAGQNGGKGGSGGTGGTAGALSIVDSYGNPIHIERKNAQGISGSDGSASKHGEGGLGGRTLTHKGFKNLVIWSLHSYKPNYAYFRNSNNDGWAETRVSEQKSLKNIDVFTDLTIEDGIIYRSEGYSLKKNLFKTVVLALPYFADRLGGHLVGEGINPKAFTFITEADLDSAEDKATGCFIATSKHEDNLRADNGQPGITPREKVSARPPLEPLNSIDSSSHNSLYNAWLEREKTEKFKKMIIE